MNLRGPRSGPSQDRYLPILLQNASVQHAPSNAYPQSRVSRTVGGISGPRHIGRRATIERSKARNAIDVSLSRPFGPAGSRARARELRPRLEPSRCRSNPSHSRIASPQVPRDAACGGEASLAPPESLRLLVDGVPGEVGHHAEHRRGGDGAAVGEVSRAGHADGRAAAAKFPPPFERLARDAADGERGRARHGRRARPGDYSV